MGKYFGTDGFRGKANEGLTAAHAYEIGRFLGWYYGREERARIVIGKDTRIRCGRLPAACDHYALGVLCDPDGRI